MNLEVISPEKKIFAGACSSVILPGIDGRLEILDRHAPLIAALGEGDLKITTSQGAQVMKITGGFAEVNNNQVSILIEGLVK